VTNGGRHPFPNGRRGGTIHGDLITVLVVDDHPAVRTGLRSVLRYEPGLIWVGEAVTAGEATAIAGRLRPDVVLADYHLPDEDGLVLCTKLKAEEPSMGVLIYSAYAGAALAVPALLAGADGLVDKSALGRDLFDAIRTVARGDHAFPEIPREHLRAAAGRLEPGDVPVLGMLLERTTLADVATTLGIEPWQLQARLLAMIGRLRVETTIPAT